MWWENFPRCKINTYFLCLHVAGKQWKGSPLVFTLSCGHVVFPVLQKARRVQVLLFLRTCPCLWRLEEWAEAEMLSTWDKCPATKYVLNTGWIMNYIKSPLDEICSVEMFEVLLIIMDDWKDNPQHLWMVQNANCRSALNSYLTTVFITLCWSTWEILAWTSRR